MYWSAVGGVRNARIKNIALQSDVSTCHTNTALEFATHHLPGRSDPHHRGRRDRARDNHYVSVIDLGRHLDAHCHLRKGIGCRFRSGLEILEATSRRLKRTI